ncbi:type II secretion system F family protein [Candidatus Gracilibacteria bacterium]|nr:type II secretion system F family protein [Candidatus Gracilibacteria bacterium]
MANEDIQIKGQENFATAGTESFDLTKEVAGNGVPTLNLTIDEEKSGVVLEKDSAAMKGGGIIGLYNRLNKALMSRSSVKTKDKATTFHLLSVMINAGIPMVRALKSLYSQMDKNPRMQMVLSALALKIEEGGSLSVAMADFRDVFSDAEISMIESGEESGQLSRVLETLALDTEKAYMIKSKVKSALMYPIIVFLMLIAVMAAMMIYVVPKLTVLFDSFGGDLPLITKIVVGISNFLINQGFLIAGVIFVGALFFYFFRKTISGRFVIDGLKLKIPIFGELLKKSYLARFARSLSNLLDSDVSIVRTLTITADSIGNEIYRRRLMMAVEDIKQGIPLAENLTESSLFPPMLVNMIDVGEKTAQLDEITAKVAKFYEEEVDTAVAGFSKIIEPVILGFVGLGVGAVVAAVMIPVMKLSNLSGVI